ncbi:hypothetical protein [Streptomyces sp. NPDC088727]|uniref:hypothetical protein n=1 Tax=Streptomyces sp. NPDC088727 TaxID=3365875 RepID=UPI00381A79AD
MPAKKRRHMPVADFDDVSMTPFMETMHQFGNVALDVKEATSILGVLLLDTAEGAWSEGQKVKDMLRVQGRPFSDRAAFSKRLATRGINTADGWRDRISAPIDEKPIPAYLEDPEIAEIITLARKLTESLQKLERKRAKTRSATDDAQAS